MNLSEIKIGWPETNITRKVVILLTGPCASGKSSFCQMMQHLIPNSSYICADLVCLADNAGNNRDQTQITDSFVKLLDEFKMSKNNVLFIDNYEFFKHNDHIKNLILTQFQVFILEMKVANKEDYINRILAREEENNWMSNINWLNGDKTDKLNYFSNNADKYYGWN